MSANDPARLQFPGLLGAVVNDALKDGVPVALIVGELEGVKNSILADAPWLFVNSHGKLHECSWCNAERQRTPDPEMSHGVCPRHRAAMLDDLAARRRERQAA